MITALAGALCTPRVASVLAIIAACGALYALRGVGGLLWSLPLLALPLGWLLPRGRLPFRRVRFNCFTW